MNDQLMKALGIDFAITLGPEPTPTHEVLAAHKDHQREISLYIGELISISWLDPTDGFDEDRKAYLDPAHRDRIWGIGNELHNLGGYQLMLSAHTISRGYMKGPHDARTLEFAWNGIGEWIA